MALATWAESLIESLAPLCLVRAKQPPEHGPGRLDAEELDQTVVCTARGAPCAEPWHPSRQPVVRLCLLGETGAGKSSLARRLVSHAFEERHCPTTHVQQHFWRHPQLLVELEDCPGIAVDGQSGEPSASGARALEQLLQPMLWYEARRREVLQLEQGAAASSCGGWSTPVWTTGRRRQPRAGDGAPPECIREFLQQGGYLECDAPPGQRQQKQQLQQLGAGGNPIGTERKRNGFIVVADISRPSSLHAALEIVDGIFERLFFCRDDPILCPVAVVVAGSHADARGGSGGEHTPPPERELRRQVEERFENVDRGLLNVTYVECSARTGQGVGELVLHAAMRAQAVPPRGQIKQVCRGGRTSRRLPWSWG